MSWIRENQMVATLLAAISVAAIASAWFLASAHSDWSAASAQLASNIAELDRLQRLAPFPSEDNLRRMKAHAEDYATAVAKLKDELKTHVLPGVPLAPSDFQSRLRVAISEVAEKARANKVKLPDRFFLGFDEFASALPDTAAAPLLGQELAQMHLLLDVMLDAHVDAVTSLRRIPTTVAEPAAKTGAKSAAAPAARVVDRESVDITFLSSPAVERRVLNAIASNEKQFYITRLLQVRNEKEKGPPREGNGEQNAAATLAQQSGAKAGAAIRFIVGEEHLETSARIEMLRFNLQ